MWNSGRKRAAKRRKKGGDSGNRERGDSGYLLVCIGDTWYARGKYVTLEVPLTKSVLLDYEQINDYLTLYCLAFM